MNELIWFSVPGAIFIVMLSSIGCWPTQSDALTIAMAPIIGFAIHQFYRTLFEATGGWARPSKQVIRHLMKQYNRSNPKEAFLIWEMTFYSDKISESFRNHNRSAWHYVMSFQSCALISGIATLISLFAVIISSKGVWWYVPIYFFSCVMFWQKARFTAFSIEKQEMATLRMYSKEFKATADKIK